MKYVTLAVLILAMIGCQKTEVHDVAVHPGTDETIIKQTTKDKAIAAKKELFLQLSGRLMEVMQSEGPAAAIEVCSNEASQFAEKVGSQQGVKIGRTAIKLRNSTNFPPTWAAKLATAEAVNPQFVNIDEQTVGVLLPIKLQQNCLKCHGPTESLAAEVKEQLAKHYPDDKATGFAEGDLRGWFWVEVPKVPKS